MAIYLDQWFGPFDLLNALDQQKSCLFGAFWVLVGSYTEFPICMFVVSLMNNKCARVSCEAMEIGVKIFLFLIDFSMGWFNPTTPRPYTPVDICLG